MTSILFSYTTASRWIVAVLLPKGCVMTSILFPYTTGPNDGPRNARELPGRLN